MNKNYAHCFSYQFIWLEKTEAEKNFKFLEQTFTKPFLRFCEFFSSICEKNYLQIYII